MVTHKQGIATSQVEYNVKHKLAYERVKRLMDITIALLLILFLLPLLIAIAVLIKIDDHEGKIFFYQERMGQNEKTFRMYKFRSMCSDAEDKLAALLAQNEADGAMFKMKDDPRITHVGKHLRSLSLDELPQLFNVLKGDMSLVGPRPCLTREFVDYSDYDKQRLMVKPGITGLWQVSGRSGLSFEQMIEMDLRYINQLSIVNDIKILLKTFIVVCKKENAY